MFNITNNSLLAKKYNFTYKKINSIQSKSDKKLKTSFIKSEKKSNLVIKCDNKINNIKKLVKFGMQKFEYNKKTIFINDISNKELLKRKPKKFNSFDDTELLIPLK
jgi:hypothetical protein